MQRTIDIEVSLNGLQVQNNPLFCEGDKNTHFLKINFMNDLDLAGYTLQIYYLPPYPCVVPYVDLFSEVTNNPFIVPIPNKILERNGEVKVEFSLSKENNLITINKIFNFEVVRTINGTSLTAYPEGTLKETIAQQIEKIKKLLAESQNKIDEYNNNATEKTQIFNDNSTEKLKAYNDNSEEKLKAYNDNDTLKTKTYNDNTDKRLKDYNDNDILKTNTYNQNATEKLEAYNNNDTSKTTAFNENVKDKTTEFDNHVSETTNRTYLEMDKKATEYANAAGERANEAVINQGNIVLGAIREEGSDQVGAVANAGATAVENIINSKDTVVQEVTDEGTTQKGIVETEGEKQARLVTNAGTEEVNKVQTAGEKAVEDINANKTANIQAVTEEGTTQVGLVRTEGEKQVGLVGDKGTEQTKLVTDEGTKQITAVGNKGTEETGKVAKEGTTQVGAVQNQGSLSLDMLLKVQKEIEAILKNQEAIGNALALNGKSGPQYDKEIQSIAGGNFDPDLMYLNDTGTKTAGKLYYDKNKSGVFKCIQTTTSTVNSTTNFVDVSSLENANKLENLSKEKKLSISLMDEQGGTIKLNLYKLGKIVFCSTVGSNFQCAVMNFSNKIPKEYLPIDGVAFTIGNSYKPEYFVQFKLNGDIYIAGKDAKLVNIPFRSFCYFTKE